MQHNTLEHRNIDVNHGILKELLPLPLPLRIERTSNENEASTNGEQTRTERKSSGNQSKVERTSNQHQSRIEPMPWLPGTVLSLCCGCPTRPLSRNTWSRNLHIWCGACPLVCRAMYYRRRKPRKLAPFPHYSYSFKIYRDNGVTLKKERTKNVIVLVKQVRVMIKSEHTKNGMQVEKGDGEAGAACPS